MRALIFGCLFFLLIGCEGASSVHEAEVRLRDKQKEVRMLKQQLVQKERELDDLRAQNSQLIQEKIKLASMKELGRAKLENVRLETHFEDPQEKHIAVKGIVKNVGKAYLEDITLKVALLDDTGNIIKVKLMPPYAPAEERMLKFFPLVDEKGREVSLDPNAQQEFEFRIKTAYFDGNSLAAVKKAIDTNSFVVRVLFRSRGD